MKSAYPKKLRFVDDPIDAGLIPDDCRDEYGVDAVKLVQHLAERCLRMSERAENAARAADSLGGELARASESFTRRAGWSWPERG